MSEKSIEEMIMRAESKLKHLKERRTKWERDVLGQALEFHPERKDEFVTDTGVTIAPVYTPLDLEERAFDYEGYLGFPGEYPFTRGISPTMYRGQPWLMRAYSGFGEVEECNKRYRQLIEWGVDEIVMAVDLPTQVGYDSDHIMAKGEVGRAGVAIDTLHDMEILFRDIPLNSLKRVSMLGNSFGPIALALFIALGEKQGLSPSEFVVDLQNDILKEYVARGTYIFPIQPSIKIVTDVIGYCANNAPHWYPCTLCANHINAAGAGSTRAAAFAMANGVCYMNRLLAEGFEIDDVAPLFSMFLDERTDFFTAVCLFRAARKVWARIMQDWMRAKNLDSMTLKITAYSHGGETLLEPLNNIVRITLAALAYVFGGVQFLYNASYDEALGTPTADAAKISLRTQQILAEELGITSTVDPLGGSYFIEALTCDLERQIYDEFSKVEKLGGAVAAIESGYYSSAITEGANRRQEEINRGQRISVGVNKYRIESSAPYGAFRIDPVHEQKQVKRLIDTKRRRDEKRVQEALARIREATEADQNLVIPVLEAVREYASVGEICGVLRSVYGEYQAREYF
jgi:methylmalonyl-CoA mutase N-terminal domain/subunit